MLPNFAAILVSLQPPNSKLTCSEGQDDQPAQEDRHRGCRWSSLVNRSDLEKKKLKE